MTGRKWLELAERLTAAAEEQCDGDGGCPCPGEADETCWIHGEALQRQLMRAAAEALRQAHADHARRERLERPTAALRRIEQKLDALYGLAAAGAGVELEELAQGDGELEPEAADEDPVAGAFARIHARARARKQ